MIHDECRLDQVLLAELLEEEVDDVALCVALLKLDAFLLGDSLSLLVSLNCIEVDSCILLDSVVHCETLERLAEVDLIVAVLDKCCTANLLS